MKPAESHTTDEQLVARYFEEAADTAVEVHLSRCDRCAARGRAVAATLDDDRRQAAAEADAAFPEARLAAQRAAILARIDHPRNARVLAFPRTAALPAAGPGTRRPARWLAAAAVLVTVSGAYGNWWIAFHQAGTIAGAGERTAVLSPARAAALPHEPDQEALLSAIDRALEQPGAHELRALDALTPDAGEPAR